MSGTDDMPAMPQPDARALDLALGVLGRDERVAAELAARADPAFARAAEEWREMLAGLDDATAPVAPPARVWERIAAETTPVVRRAPAPAPRRMPWSWRAAALIPSAVAAGLAVLLLRPHPAPRPPAAGPLVGTMLANDGASVLAASYDPGRAAVIITPASSPSLKGRVPELWLIPAGGKPRSLGLIDLNRPQTRPIPAAYRPLVTPGATLAISLEPAGGSPSGAPTGPVIAHGTLATI